MNFDKLVEKYMAQGFNYRDAYERAGRYMYNRRRYEEQKKIRDAINQLKVDDPAEYQRLVYVATHAEEVVTEERERVERLREEQKRLEEQRLFKFRHGLVVTGVPHIEFSSVEGMIAFRTWNVKDADNVIRRDTQHEDDGLFLGSTAMSSVWKSVMIADRIPTENNDSGLYCVKLDPLGLMTRASYYLGDVCGLLELRGRILEHTDGVVRAEWARIMCVFIQANEKTEDIYGGLCRAYPTVPMHVLHKEQIAEILLRVTVMQSMRD